MQHLHRDHLGSIDKITDESGAILQTLAFEPVISPFLTEVKSRSHAAGKDSDWQRIHRDHRLNKPPGNFALFKRDKLTRLHGHPFLVVRERLGGNNGTGGYRSILEFEIHGNVGVF